MSEHGKQAVGEVAPHMPLWQQLGEICDDLSDVDRRLREVKTAKATRRAADAYMHCRLSFHAHMRLGATGDELQTCDLCLSAHALAPLKTSLMESSFA